MPGGFIGFDSLAERMADIFLDRPFTHSHVIGEDTYYYHLLDFTMPFGSILNAYDEAPILFKSRLCWGKYDLDNKHYYSIENNYDHRIRALICRYCEKLPSYLLSKCFLCSNIYIKDFRSTRSCIFVPCCWDCLSQLPWTCCRIHEDKYYSKGILVEELPLGFNPKTFSQKELDDFDIFAEL